MGQLKFETPTGTIDGANTVFFVSQPYVPGSTAVWINGILLDKSLDDGWIESDPSTGEITFKEAPQGSGACPDVLQVFYKDTSEDSPETVIEEICGVVEDFSSLDGNLFEIEDTLFGVLSGDLVVSGLLQEEASVVFGVLEDDTITGILEEC